MGGGGDEPSDAPYDLGFQRSPPPIDSDAMDEAFCGLKLKETKENGTVEVVVEVLSEGEEGRGGEREEAGDGDGEKKEIEEGGERSDSDGDKKKSVEREEKRNADRENIESEEREVGSDCDSAKKETQEREEGRDGDSEKIQIQEREEGIDGDSEKIQIQEREEGKGGESGKNEGDERVKVRVKFPIPYPQRTGTRDCAAYLRTGHCSFGSVCFFNHPPKKRSKVYENRDCKETDGDPGKKECGERGKAKLAPPYPVREGKEDCVFYLKTGRCDFGAKCCFNHPPKDSITTP